jgi:hypothetical protein
LLRVAAVGTAIVVELTSDDCGTIVVIAAEE